MEKSELENPYERLSPSERNQKLREIFESVPKTSGREVDETINKGVLKYLVDNARSEKTKKRLSSSLKILLNNHSFLTKSGQQYLLNDFDDLYDQGVEEETADYIPDMVERAVLLRWDNPQNPGIFNKSAVEQIEHDLYKKAIETRLLQLKIQTDFDDQNMKRRTHDETFLFETSKTIMTDDEVAELAKLELEEDLLTYELSTKEHADKTLIASWRNEYIDRYADEP